MAVKSFVRNSLRNATLAAVFATVMPGPVWAAPDDAATSEQQIRNRSNFQYHDGHADERRPYRRPNLDIDPTNLKIEELVARINSLEERIETLEYQAKSLKRGQ